MKRNLEELLTIGRMGKGTPVEEVTNCVKGLIDLCNFVGITDKTMCEVGCFVGTSTETFLNFSPKKLYAVDPWLFDSNYDESNWVPLLQSGNWDGVYLEFMKMAEHYPNVEVIRDFSVNAAKRFEDGGLDLVYVDGFHAQAEKDFEAWWPKIKLGGWLTGHDYRLSEVAIQSFSTLQGSPIKTFEDDSWAIRIARIP
jgi:hypothetical protein